mmetsp:Transcript_56105/g.121362  ORF Transcript_56105/g.121362 Transcript_56105/m.121362 type:complete len:1117 (-) Transcript_56105:113-3463(-)
MRSAPPEDDESMKSKTHDSIWTSPKAVLVVLAVSVLINLTFVWPGPSLRAAFPFGSTTAGQVLDFPSQASPAIPRSLADAAETSSSTASSDTSLHDAASSSAGAHGDAHGGEHAEHTSHYALLFLFDALVVGAAVMHVAMFFPTLQQTVVLFVLGMVISLILEGFHLKEDLGEFGASWDIWMQIDPHLLLFALLPALLAGDAMSIDISVAQHVKLQCLYLAGPGVLINAFAVAGFLKLYLPNWDFLLCLVTGSILCATDPVAVVALLKELGASPTLTVQIQGESLLNDGTAIVLFMISYNILSGEEYDWAEILMFLIIKAMMAWALGMFFGHFFFGWIRLASNRLNHNSGMIQITLTICCAYWSFIIAEGVLGISGVLSTVAASLVLAQFMWPHIVSPESLHNVWHMIEALGNTVIFFVAGALTGEVMATIPGINYLHLIVLYIVLVMSRGALIFASRPLLQYLSKDGTPVSMADATVMTWGGLRGAVGLALAIRVRNERAPNATGDFQVDEASAQQVLFFVGGIALLTTVINAVTAPALVNYLGITAAPRAQLKLLTLLIKQLLNKSKEDSNPPEVNESLEHMLKDIEHHITMQKSKSGVDEAEAKITPADTALRPGSGVTMADNLALVEDIQQREEKFRELLEKNKLGLLYVAHTGGAVTWGISQGHLLTKVDDLMKLLSHDTADAEMQKVVNQAFLKLVERHYWKQIECGDLRAGSDEASALLTSIQVALSPLTVNLRDFDFVKRRVERCAIVASQLWRVFSEDAEDVGPDVTLEKLEKEKAQSRPFFERVVHSSGFNITMAVAIVLNAIWVAIEEGTREDHHDVGLWLTMEAIFCVVFTLEAVVKILVMQIGYFRDKSNLFDFMLVVFGDIGVILSIIQASASKGQLQSLTSIIRISRVFRVMRFLRVFRIFHAKLSADKDISPMLAAHMVKVSAWMSFIGAHIASQAALLKYFGGSNSIDGIQEAEIARCVLQSQVAVYKAIDLTIQEESKVGDALLMQEMKWVYERKEITESLEDFVMAAYGDGAITGKEAESMVHPLREQISQCLWRLHACADGIAQPKVGSRTITESLTGSLTGSLARRLSSLSHGSASPKDAVEPSAPLREAANPEA